MTSKTPDPLKKRGRCFSRDLRKPAFMGEEDAKIWLHLFKAAVYAIPLLGAFHSGCY